MFREVYTQDIDKRANAPEILSLLRTFEACAKPGDGAPYGAFNLAVLDAYRDHMMVLTPDGAGDYTYIHYGREVAKGAGSDMSGRNVSDLTRDIALFTISCYDRALREGVPVYSIHRSFQTAKVALWERLILPVIAQGGRRFIFVFTKALEFREELLATILNSSPMGILALQALRGPEGSITDAVIVTANRRACEITGREADDLLGCNALTALPMLVRTGVWGHCVEVMERGEPQYIEAHVRLESRDHWFQVSLAPLRDGVTMTFSDVTDLKLANLALQSRAATLAVEVGRERATAEALSNEVHRQRVKADELRLMAETDPLTGVLNRRSFQMRLDAVHARSRETGQPMSLLIVDLDHFKSVNDTYGHSAGDAAIRHAAQRLSERIRRDGDIIARIGGEEFAVILPNTPISAAFMVAEGIRTALASRPVELPDGRAFPLTASVGVAQMLPGEDLNPLFERADEALYAAKGLGRNRVEIARRNSLSSTRAA